MSIQAMVWVLDHSEAGGSSRLVLLVIANHAHGDGTRAYPSVATVAAECRMSGRQIQRILHQLVEEGHLEVTGVSPLQTNVYRVAGMTPERGDEMSPPVGDTESPGGDVSGRWGETRVTAGGDTRVTQSVRSSVSNPSSPVARASDRDNRGRLLLDSQLLTLEQEQEHYRASLRARLSS